MSQPVTTSSAARAWLELIRLPNLFTVPGDVLAGACLAAAAGLSTGGLSPLRLAVAAAAAIAVYAGGLIDNDLVDAAEDARERPARPLPSRRVSVNAARTAMTLLFLVPFLISWTGIMPPTWTLAQALLVAVVMAYNRIKGLVPVLGFLLMGLCRGLNLLAGAALIGMNDGRLATVMAAVCWTLYVAGITLFASHETRRAPGTARYLLILPLAGLGLAGLLPGLPGLVSVSLVAAALAGTTGVLEALWQCPPGPDPARVPRTVGRLVRLLIPMQALLCLASPSWAGGVAAAGLLVAWFAAARLGRIFYAS